MTGWPRVLRSAKWLCAYGGVFAIAPFPVSAAPTLEVGVTATHQAADSVAPETLASIDAVGRIGIGAGSFTVHLEGSTTPETNGASARYPGTNGDAGSALDGRGHGRGQLSEAFYSVRDDRYSAAAGFIDPTRFLDATGNPLAGTSDGFANDETGSLLGAAFVNNPTIAFPDYSLGVTASAARRGGRQRLRAMLAGGTGLADTPNARYGELVDLGVRGRGLFAAVETFQALPEGRALRAGVWRNSRGPGDNYGVYAVLDGAPGAWRWNARAGMGEGQLAAEGFVGAAAERDVVFGDAGGGLAWIDRANENDQWQAELYWRIPLGQHLHVTPDVQWIHQRQSESAAVVGLRVNALWSAF